MEAFLKENFSIASLRLFLFMLGNEEYNNSDLNIELNASTKMITKKTDVTELDFVTFEEMNIKISEEIHRLVSLDVEDFKRKLYIKHTIYFVFLMISLFSLFYIQLKDTLAILLFSVFPFAYFYIFNKFNIAQKEILSFKNKETLSYRTYFIATIKLLISKEKK